MFIEEAMFVLIFALCHLDKTLSQNHEVWRSTRMVKAACEQEEKYQETGQFPAPIQDQEQRDYCGWFSKGKPRGDACADIRVHFSSCENKSIARHVSARVINGTNARRAFPHLAYFIYCSGSVVNNQWLLTAGHCLCGHNGVHPPYRILGLYDRGDNSSNPFRISLEREKDFCPDNYSKDPLQLDIALSKVTKFEYNEGVQPIRMPPSRDFRYMGPAYLVAYGYINPPNQGLVTDWTFVQEVTLPVISVDVCRDLFPEYNESDEVHVCAGAFGTGRRACYGDSGGPLFVCQNYQLVQYGILSGGAANCGDVPSVFMRLSHFADWISKTIENN